MQLTATFQNMMNDIFLIETDEGWILIYIDDILIFSKERKDLQKLTLRVLKKLQENDLFVNLDKCTFEAKEVDYLGMIVSENQNPTSPGLILIKGQKDAKPFSQVTCDFITDLPESDGFDSLMVVVDHGSTKGVISIPCNKTIDATLTAQNYIDHVY